MMTKKDYQAIARVLYQTKTPTHSAQHAATILGLARLLAADNPKFNRQLFLEACETGKCRGMRLQGEEDA